MPRKLILKTIGVLAAAIFGIASGYIAGAVVLARPSERCRRSHVQHRAIAIH